MAHPGLAGRVPAAGRTRREGGPKASLPTVSYTHLEFGTDTFAATAEVLEGAERDRVYAAQAADFANFAEYQTMTDRVIPVVRLVRD